MTSEMVKNLKLGVTPIDDRTVLVVESGFEWLKRHTTLEFDINSEESLKALPASVRLFLINYVDIQFLGVGVSSQSIEGLSQSFNASNTDDLIWQKAEELLGDYLKSRVRFVAAQSRWK